VATPENKTEQQNNQKLLGFMEKMTTMLLNNFTYNRTMDK